MFKLGIDPEKFYRATFICSYDSTASPMLLQYGPRFFSILS